MHHKIEKHSILILCLSITNFYFGQFSSVSFKDSVFCTSKNTVFFEVQNSMVELLNFCEPKVLIKKPLVTVEDYNLVSKGINESNKNSKEKLNPTLNPFETDDYFFQIISFENQKEYFVVIICKSQSYGWDENPICMSDGGYCYSIRKIER